MNSRTISKISLYVLISSLLLLSDLAAAQAVLEEIIVTAQKREQSLQEVPISVVAIGGETIQDRGLKKLEDITAAVPNIIITEGALGDNLFIRGIGSGTNIGFEQSVGTFIDGVYFGRGLQSRNSFLDVERVEILRGPQSTFFGNNTVAGALSVTTRGPTDQWEGYGLASYEDGTGSKNAEAAVGGPVSDTLGVRLAARLTNQDGWQTNTTIDKKEPRERRRAGRITLRWAPLDNFNATLKYQIESSGTRGRNMQAFNCPPTNGQPPAGYCFAFGVLGPQLGIGPEPDFVFDRRRNGGNGASPFPTDEDFNSLLNRSGNLTMNWQVLDHTVTSVTGYSFYDNHRSQSAILLAGPFPAPVLPIANIEHAKELYEQYSQELRITSPSGGRVEYLAGFYYQTAELDVTNDFSAAPFATRLSRHVQDEETFAVFGALTWHITERLRLTGGLRYTSVDKDVRREQILASNQGNLVLADAIPMQPSNPFFGAFVFGFGWQSGILEASRSDSDLTPSVNIQYDLTEDIMGYFSYSDGFKAGGFDEQNGVLNPATVAFKPESVDAFELGIKTSLLDNRMMLNIAMFRNEFTNLQVQTFDGVINFLVTNAGEAIAQGVEVDLLWQATDRLQIGLQAAYLDATWEDRRNGQCTSAQAAMIVPGCDFTDPTNPVQDLTGARLPYAPEFSGNISVTHVYPLANGFRLTTNLLMIFEDEIFTVDDNETALARNGIGKLDASISLSSAENKWQLSVIGRNLTDKLTFSNGNDLPLSAGSFYRFLDKPRTIAVQGRYNW